MKNNEIRAFYNTCRHHASKIVNTQASKQAPGPTGSVSNFMCPYHGWTYNLDGKLINAPKSTGCELNYDEYGLKPIRSGKLGPFIFICFNANAAPLESKWPQVFNRLEFSKLIFYCTKSYTVNCNWKVYVVRIFDLKSSGHIPSYLISPSALRTTI
jgi:phenylpropionate dioxygenase-like ring-hydroxylating dioxygenase large terminal subunit